MRRLIALAAAAMLSGCATGPIVYRLPVSTGLSSSAVPARISAADAARVDHYKISWRPLNIVTGPIWASVFTGGPADPLLTVQSVKSSMDLMHGMGYAPQFAYSVTAILHLHGASIPLEATGTGSAGLGFGHPEQTAVNEAVLKIARQVRTVLNANAVAKAAQ